MSEPTAMEMEGAEAISATVAKPDSSQPAAPPQRAEAEQKEQEPIAPAPVAPVHPSMLRAMERHCAAARVRLQEMRQRCKDIESDTSHRALTQASGVAAQPCPATAALVTVVNTKSAADLGSNRASASVSSSVTFSPPSLHSPRFDIGGLRVDAIQTFLTRAGEQLEQWRISVQITNTAQRRFEQLQLDALEEPAAISRLSTIARTASLAPGQSVCLALQLHLPDDRPALTLGLSISWLESKHWTSAHHIASLTLPPWTVQGQHTLLRHPNAQPANEQAITPMLSLLDCAHHVDLSLLSTDAPAAGTLMLDSSAASSGFSLHSLLQQEFGFESPPPSSDSSCMLSWLRSSRPSLSSLDASAFLLQPAAPRLTACITSNRSLVVFGSSPVDLMRFVRAMQSQLQPSMRLTVEESTAEVQRAGDRLLAAMTHENEGQLSALQRSFPQAFAAASSNGPRATGSAALSGLQFMREIMPLQEATNQAATNVVALL